MADPLAITIKGSARIGSKPLFARIQLELEAGKWTCLLGGSGVGKSTILRVIAGLDTGATFEGAVTASDGGKVPERVAYMAQDDLLLPWASVAENAALGARMRREKVDRARLDRLLDQTGLARHATKRPAALSGGERQRVALVRTLMEDRPVILLDEPFSALDAKTRADMQDLAAEMLTGRTVFLVTHDPAEAARIGDRIEILSARGLTAFVIPDGKPPREVDDPAVLKVQAALTRHLRTAA